MSDDDIIGYCTTCGLSHSKGARLKRLRRMLPEEARGIRESYSCIYGRGANRERMLYRDLHDLGARKLRQALPGRKRKTSNANRCLWTLSTN